MIKIKQWLGYNEDASQYLLRPGELSILNNLQSRRPGMLLSRSGLKKIYGRYDDESIYALFRRATILGDTNDFIWLQKITVPKILTIEEIEQGLDNTEEKWAIKRVLGDQSRVIDTLDLKPNGETEMHNFCIAEDRRGRLFIFYGHGVRPRLYLPESLDNSVLDMGVDAPEISPVIKGKGRGQFIESVAVRFAGGSYHSEPTIRIEGDSTRTAKLTPIIDGGRIVGVEVEDGGAGYESAPTIVVEGGSQGRGFRALGNIASSGADLIGFAHDNAAALYQIAPHGEPTSEQRYGTKPAGTEDQKIQYVSRDTDSIEDDLITGYDSATDTFTMSSVIGLIPGDRIRIYPHQTYFEQQNITVGTIDKEQSTFTTYPSVSTNYSYTAGDRLEIQRVSYKSVNAKYNPVTKRYTATFPIKTLTAAAAGADKSDGKEAEATLQFMPKSFGFAVNTASPWDSIETTVSKWQTQNNGAEYLYNEFWQGSDFDRKGSAENSQYGGLQASGTNFVRGFSGTTGGRTQDVYWPDYSKISVWMCVGTYSSNRANWRRVDVPVTTETTTTASGDTISAKILEFTLPATAKQKTARDIHGDLVSSEYEDWDGLPDAVGPTVRLYLRECPSSWVMQDGDFCSPTDEKEKRQDRLAWWVPGTRVSRPIVDIVPEGGEIDENAVTIVDPGKGWAKDALFAFRIYQANAYAQKSNFNTASSVDTLPGGHAITDESKYAEFRLRATAPDSASTPDGPPHQLVSPCYISSYNDGWESGDAALLSLLRINNDDESVEAGTMLSWAASTVETLSSDRKQIISAQILTKGHDYHAEPIIESSGGGKGYGVKASPVLKNGQIVDIIIDDGGRDYDERPEFFTESRQAKLSAVMRPAIKGRYRCAYRYVDRSETIVATLSATRDDSDNTLLFDDTSAIKPDMVLESPDLPWNSIVTSVNGNQVEINQKLESTTFIEGHAKLTVLSAAQTEMIEPNVLITGDEKLRPGEYYSPNEEYKLEINNYGVLTLGEKYRYRDRTGFDREDYRTVLYTQGSYGSSLPDGVYLSIVDDKLRMTEEELDANGGLVSESILWEVQIAAGSHTLELHNGGELATFNVTPVSTVTVRDLTKPITYSDFSPIVDFDAGPNVDRKFCSEITWDIPGVQPPLRADLVEFWRTSSGQSLVFYRTEAYGLPSPEGITVVGKDTLTDEELFDPDRAHYQALPVVLPNGNLNAYRFGKPRDDMSVAVPFQDRLFMGVSTSGEKANTVFYSEFDEFESFPDVNELPIQLNQKTTDVLTALVPFGSMLLLMQHTHTYSLAYNTDPAIDASIQMMSHRGTLHQRCWDIHENVLFSVDESGIYAMSRTGEVQDVSLPIRDFFVSEVIDFSKREKFFLQVDPRTHILRFFCTLKTNSTDTPSIALCYDIQAKAWWTESYPNSITSSCTGRPSATKVNTILLGAVDGNMYEIDGNEDHSNQCLTDTEVRVGGRGYTKPPEITVPNCIGAKVQAVVTEGALVDVVIHDAGWRADYGIDILTEDDKIIAGHDDRHIQGAEYAPIKLIIDPPNPGGIQAEAKVNFSVLPVIRRQCTVSKGESFVRILKTDVPQLEPLYHPWIVAEDDTEIHTQDDKRITEETKAAEIGMEVIGEHIPLNSFVSRIDGDDVYMEHPDGTPVSILFGAERTNLYPTNFTRLELGGTEMEVEFRKPAATNIPYRMVTGAMQLTNEENTRAGDRLADRSISMVYTPTSADKTVDILERFNGREDLRANSARNSRTGAAGWVHRQDSASTRLNLADDASHLGVSTGVAKATFASRAYTDMAGEDQHLMLEIHGDPTRSSKFSRTNFWIKEDNPDPNQFVMHSLTINGVDADG